MNTEIVFAGGARLVATMPLQTLAERLFGEGVVGAVEISVLNKGTVMVNPASVAYLASTALA